LSLKDLRILNVNPKRDLLEKTYVSSRHSYFQFEVVVVVVVVVVGGGGDDFVLLLLLLLLMLMQRVPAERCGHSSSSQGSDLSKPWPGLCNAC